jgi:translation initiation factor RLI1
MDNINLIIKSIHSIMDEYITEESIRPNNSGVEFKKIIDPAQHQYQLMQIGWDGTHRVYDLIFHIEIKQGKIWIQEDNLEHALAEQFIEHGISKKDIVLAYLPESHRVYMDYALA